MNINPGTVLFSRGATPKVSSPQQRFTSEFGMESVWFHRAKGTRKLVGSVSEPWRLHSNLSCLSTNIFEVKTSVY